MPEVPPSPDYIPGPEEPQSPPPLDFVPEPMYPEYMPQEDEILLAEEQPLPAAAASPTADSPGYVPESDPEEEPEEDDEDPEEDPADYPADGDDDDDEDEDEDEDEEEEEEHPAPADSVPPVHRMTARISIRDEPSISLPPREEEHPMRLHRPPRGVLNLRVTIRATSLLRWTTIMYGIMEDAQDDREREAKMAREAWGLSVDASDYARSDVMSLQLQSADHKRQRVISELLASDHKRQVQLTKTLRLLKGLQTQMAEFQRQHGPAKGPAQPDAPGEAGSSS
ncbi:hypothetical protein Tco_1216986 [Tanacetum coccineum]